MFREADGQVCRVGSNSTSHQRRDKRRGEGGALSSTVHLSTRKPLSLPLWTHRRTSTASQGQGSAFNIVLPWQNGKHPSTLWRQRYVTTSKQYLINSYNQLYLLKNSIASQKRNKQKKKKNSNAYCCLLYTSDAADE